MARRRPGVALGFGAAVWALLLGSARVQAQANRPCVMVEHPYPALAEDPHRAENLGGEFMASFVRSFLHTVQPKPFPEDLIREAVENPQQFQNPEMVKQALYYEIGFLVCVAIAVVYIVLMPIIGFFLACCRCCGNCGGKMEQKQVSSTNGWRRTLYFLAFVTTVIILAGNVCMFKSNQVLKESVNKGLPAVNTTVGDLQHFLDSIPQQIEFVVNESSRTVNKVSGNLDDIGSQLGSQIEQEFVRTLQPAFSSVRDLDEETEGIGDKVRQLNTLLDQLQSDADAVQANFNGVKGLIIQTLSKPNCIGCEGLKSEVEAITLETAITVPGLAQFQSEVDEINGIDLNSKIREVEETLNSIPQRVTNETQDLVRSSKQQLAQITEQTSGLSSSISSSLGSVSTALDPVPVEVERISPDVERAEYIRWAICLAVCCVVLLVVVCYFLGLTLGPLGLNPRSDPTERSGTADCGGTFFMMGAGISFLFSWLFMIVVVVLFVVGGNVYTLLCQPWKSGVLLRFVDDNGVIPGLNEVTVNGVRLNISLTGIYSGCEHNEALWAVLDLSRAIDLDEMLNVSKYSEQIQQQFDATDITLPPITILSADIENQLGSFSSKVATFNFTGATQQANNTLSINLNTTADTLDGFAANQPATEIQTELRDEARDLRLIQGIIETTIFPKVETLNSVVMGLQSTLGAINGTVSGVLSNVEAAKDFIDTNASKTIRSEAQHFLDCQLSYFTAYTAWAKSMITQEIGRCLPVAAALDSAHTIVCSNMVESLNAYWFSLGWCIIFFIPGIIFSIKLAKYYRRMKYSDAPISTMSSNHIIMNHIPRAQMKYN